MKKTTKRNLLLLTGVLGMSAMIFGVTEGNARAAYALEHPGFDGVYTPDFSSLEESQAYSENLNVKLMEESVVLLKNKDNALPLERGSAVSLLGIRSYEPVIGGTGSGSSAGDTYEIQQSLKDVGFEFNEVAREFYGSHRYTATFSTGLFGNSASVYDGKTEELFEALGDTIHFYNDAAIITLGRIGGEGGDLYMHNIPTQVQSDRNAHVLRLFDNEKTLIDTAKQNFKKVIVLINSANVFEIPELEDDPEVDAIMWIGEGGSTGLKAIGPLLVGDVNPSAKTVDIWPANFEKDPTYQNFADSAQHNKWNASSNSYANTYNHNAYTNASGLSGNAFTLEEEEGIYFGYKYYETAAAEDVLDKLSFYDATKATIPADKDGDKYYNRDTGVVYPFGFGLSYTTFEKSIVSSASEVAAAINTAGSIDDFIKVKVSVKNTGAVAGKEVVQLYNHAPYTSGGIEKAEVSFVGFEKTRLLKPGESQVLSVDVRVGDIASFDYNDANHNNFAGWEIEAGEYAIRLQDNSHEKVQEIKVNLNKRQFKEDGSAAAADLTANDSYNRFSKGNDYDTLLNMKDEGSTATMKLMSRKDFVNTFPTVPTRAERTYTGRVFALLTNSNIRSGTSKTTNYGTQLRYSAYFNSSDDLATDPWYATNEDIPADWTQAADTSKRTRENRFTDVILSEMAGLDYWNDVDIVPQGHPYAGKTHAQAWTEFMNQLTYAELCAALSNGGYRTPALGVVGKKQSGDQDGPASLNGTSGGMTTNAGARGTSWLCEVNIASTYNKDLCHKQGLAVGNEALFNGSSGWYGPAMNTHRSPFAGRNFEYYSQDGVQGGYIAAAVISGAQSKGCVVWAKHFAMNDQETQRTGIGTFFTEQVAREVQLKQFEYAIKYGHAQALMSAYNRVGGINAFANWELINGLARGEWGFKGMAVTDYYQSSLAKANYLERGGCDLPLNGTFNYQASSTGQSIAQNNLTGNWDASLRNGKGGVRDGITSGGVVPESPTQYKTMRDCATRVLWCGANSSNNQNGVLTVGGGTSATNTSTIRFFDFASTASAKAGATVNVNCAAISSLVSGHSAQYVIAVSSTDQLPEGLTMNASNGRIQGTTTKVGTYRLTVGVVLDGYILRTSNLTLTIEPTQVIEGTVGEMIYIPVTGYVEGDKVGSYTINAFETHISNGFNLVSISAEEATEALPAGKYLCGMAGAASTFNVEYSQTVTYRQSNNNRTQTNAGTYQVVVKAKTAPTPGEGEEPVVDHGGISKTEINEAGELVITYQDGVEVNLGVIKGADGKDGKGCGSTIGAVSAITLISVLALSFAGYVALRNIRGKKED